MIEVEVSQVQPRNWRRRTAEGTDTRRSPVPDVKQLKGVYPISSEAWGPGFRFGRRFATRQERIARLEEYRKELQAEVKAVQERIAEMKAAG